MARSTASSRGGRCAGGFLAGCLALSLSPGMAMAEGEESAATASTAETAQASQAAGGEGAGPAVASQPAEGAETSDQTSRGQEPSGQPAGGGRVGPAEELPPVDVRHDPPSDTPDPQKTPDARPKDYREGWGWAGLPLANYNSDDGFGYGVKVALYNYGQNQKPYKQQLSLQLFFTTRHVMYHRLFFDAPRFMGTPWRLDVKLKFDRQLLKNYFGVGNTAYVDYCDSSTVETLDLTCASPTDLDYGTDFDDLSADDQTARQDRLYNYYTSYQSIDPALVLNLRRDLRGPFRLFTGLQVKHTIVLPHSAETILEYTDIQVEDDWTSYLEREKPYGYGGGTAALVQLGMVFDSRNREPSPDKGAFSDVSFRLVYNHAGDETERAEHTPVYGGVNLTHRQFFPLAKNLVFAGRLVGDFMLGSAGSVPFYELISFGGIQDQTGLGGDVTLRGVKSGRYRGMVKVIATPELRWTPMEFYPAKSQKINVGFVLFADAGRTWAGYASDGPSTIHFGTGLGLRVAWNDNFLIRLDLGKNLEYSADDALKQKLESPGWLNGFYLTFDHAF